MDHCLKYCFWIICIGECFSNAYTYRVLSLNDQPNFNGLQSTPSCDEEWEEYEGHCYFFSSDYRNWDGAKEYCESKDSILVKIESWEENTWINKRLKKSANWIGGIRLYHGGFVWYNDRQDFFFSNFYYGEPNNADGFEDCVQITEVKDGAWNDANCSNHEGYICKKTLL